MQVTHLRAEYRSDAAATGHVLGVASPTPRLSWWVVDAPDGWRQTGYDIELTRGDTAPRVVGVESADQVFVPWPDAPLASREQVRVRVRVRGDIGDASDWSQPLVVEAALWNADDWTARLVQPDPDVSGVAPRAATLLRTQFTVREAPASARLYLTAHGLVVAELNGQRVGDQELAPGWTSYAHRLTYTTFDVTGQVRTGENVIGAWLGDGWFRGFVGFEGGVRNLYGDRTGLLAQLEVTYPDGSRDVVGTDDTWRSTTSPVVAAGLYEGETHDARFELPGWSEPGFDAARWGGVREAELDLSTLEPPLAEPVRVVDELPVREVITTPRGRTVLDFGQNASGRLRLRVRGAAGGVVTLRHAEVLENGELGTRPLRQAAQTDRYVLRGAVDEEGNPADEVWEPKFTVHGFRYAEVQGWPDAAAPLQAGTDAVTFRVLHTAMERTGWWECSDERLTRLHENVRWGLVGNSVSIPTDCPQRDERLGWTGDIAVFAPTAAALYDTGGFLASWLRDVALEQSPQGFVPVYVPYVPTMFPPLPFAIWGDASVLVPWAQYQRLGDRDVLAAQFESMTRWVDLAVRRTHDTLVWDGDVQLGDWLDPTAPPDRPADARTSGDLVATAFLARSLRVVAQAASVIGNDDAATRYADLASRAEQAFRDTYMTPAGRMASDAQTAYALPLAFGLVPDSAVAASGDHLAQLVRDGGFHIGTGFAGTPVICDALAVGGHLDDAYHLLLTDTVPSWLYQVSMGATTIWERWDSMLPDGSINPGDMTSFNHYALGAVADFMDRVIGGLDPVDAGFRRFRVAPRPGGGLASCRTRRLTPYGEASVEWTRSGEQLQVSVQVPVGTTAVVDIPGFDAAELTAGRHQLTGPCRAAADDPARPAAQGLFDRVGEQLAEQE